NLLADAHHHGQEDHDEQGRCGDKRHRDRPDQQSGRPLLSNPHCTSSTGSAMSIDADDPDLTSTVLARSPMRSCHPTMVYVPAGTFGIVNDPSSSGIVKYGWSSTRIDALMCEWMWQYTFTSPALRSVIDF